MQYRIGNITLLTGKYAFSRDGDETELQEIPYKILLFMVRRAIASPGTKITVEEIASHVWPEERQTDLHDLKRRIHSHVRTLRANGIDCLSKGTHGGYLLHGDVIEETPRGFDVNAPASHGLTSSNFILACALTCVVTLVVTALVRGLVTSFGITLTQAPQFGFVSGVFQAVFGSLAWSVPLSLVLLRGWMSHETYTEWRAELRPSSLLWAGAIAGAFGGVLVDVALIFAQQKETLLEAGWILESTSSRWSAFSVTKVGYAEPAMGITVGFCCAVFMWLALHRPELATMAKSSKGFDSLSEAGQLLYQVFRRVFAWTFFLIDLPVMFTGAALCFWIRGPVALSRFLGEGFIIGTAGVAFTTGLLTSVCAFAQGPNLTDANPVYEKIGPMN